MDVSPITMRTLSYIKFGEGLDKMGKLIVNSLLGELDLPHIELADSLNFVSLVDHSWRFPLCFR